MFRRTKVCTGLMLAFGGMTFVATPAANAIVVLGAMLPIVAFTTLVVVRLSGYERAAETAAASAQAVTPRLRGGLQAAGVSAGVQQQIVAGFQACARDRARARTSTPTAASSIAPAGSRMRAGAHSVTIPVTARLAGSSAA